MIPLMEPVAAIILEVMMAMTPYLAIQVMTVYLVAVNKIPWMEEMAPTVYLVVKAMTPYLAIPVTIISLETQVTIT